MKRLSPSAYRLFELARGQDDPDELTRNRVGHALSVKMATGVGATVAGASAAKAATGLGWMAAKATLVVGVAGVLGTTGWLALRPSRPAVPAVPSRPQAPVLAPVTPAVEETPIPAVPEATKAPGKAPAVRKLVRPFPPSEAPVVSPTVRAEDELRPEAEALRLAQQALRDKEPLQALKLLDAQDVHFRDGLLQQERAAMRVLALCQAGRADEARVQAGRFEQLWPRSPLFGRVRSACWNP